MESEYSGGQMRYHGEWQGGKKQGKGILYMNNQEIYQGCLENDVFDGKGQIYLMKDPMDCLEGWMKDGNVDVDKILKVTYNGDFKNGQKHGKGMF